jgi:hypothetical protein
MLIIINLKKKLNNNCIDCILQYLLWKIFLKRSL